MKLPESVLIVLADAVGSQQASSRGCDLATECFYLAMLDERVNKERVLAGPISRNKHIHWEGLLEYQIPHRLGVTLAVDWLSDRGPASQCGRWRTPWPLVVRTVGVKEQV